MGKWLRQGSDSPPVPPQAQLGRRSLLHPPPLREIHLPPRVSAALGGFLGGFLGGSEPSWGRAGGGLSPSTGSESLEPSWLCCCGQFLQLGSTRGYFLSPPVLFVPGGCRERPWSSLCIPWGGRRGLSRKGRGLSPPAALRFELKHPKMSLHRPRIPVTLNMKMVMPSWSVLLGGQGWVGPFLGSERDGETKPPALGGPGKGRAHPAPASHTRGAGRGFG